jgi:hypothetical protein
MRLAAAGLFVLAGVGIGSLLSPLVGTAFATVGQTVNISDHSASAYFAKVDSAGKLAVGDGAGPLSVDGTVSGRPVAPASPWHAQEEIQSTTGGVSIAGPSASPINLTSLSISTNAPSGEGVPVLLHGGHVLTNAATCNGATIDQTVWYIRDAGDGVTPLSFTFPTPLQWKSPANTKACLVAIAGGNFSVSINAVGFYGG